MGRLRAMAFSDKLLPLSIRQGGRIIGELGNLAPPIVAVPRSPSSGSCNCEGLMLGGPIIARRQRFPHSFLALALFRNFRSAMLIGFRGAPSISLYGHKAWNPNEMAQCGPGGHLVKKTARRPLT